MNPELKQSNVNGKEHQNNGSVRDDAPNDDTDHDSDDDEGTPSFENVLEYLGVPGKYQFIQIGVAQMSLCICTFMVMSIVFVGYIPYHECKKINETQLTNRYLKEIKGNETAHVSAHVFYDACDVRVVLTLNQSTNLQEKNGQIKIKTHSLSCPNGRDFFDAKDTTYASEWDLVCESKGMAEFTQTLFTIGQIIGGIISSPITDYFGRKLVVVASSCLCCLVDIAHVLSPNMTMVYVINTFSGLFFQTAFTTIFILSIELVVPRHRYTLIYIFNMLWIFYVLVVGTVAYFVQDQNWRYFHGASIVSGLVAFVTPFVLKESPRWLTANGKYEEALDIVKVACKTNSKDFEIAKQKFNTFVSYKYKLVDQVNVPLVSTLNDDKTKEMYIDYNGKDSSSKSEMIFTPPNSAQKNAEGKGSIIIKSSPFSMFRNKRMLMLLGAGWYLWLTNTLVYYGLYMTSSSIAGNRFVNFILMDLVEIPSLTLCLYLMTKMGRRLVFGIFIGSTGVCLMVSALMATVGEGLSGSDITITVMFILGKFSISASFSVLYVITTELFPTNIRTTALGCCSALGRLGGMIAPYMRLFHSEVKWGPALLFTVMCCLAVVVTFFLPETKGRDLPSTLADVINSGKISTAKKRSRKDKNRLTGFETL